jgi:site-specific DNA recombinase
MKTQDLKFFVYCRKSSEDAQRQVASINDQVNALQKIIDEESLELSRKPYEEERSSKDPGRPLFNEMLDRIEKGEANAILCWDIDRLYRNPVDEGKMRWMLQKGVIKVIRTPSRQFYPDDAGLLMGVEGGRATDYVIRLSKNVKRGLGGKVKKGVRPSPAPIGYMNVGEVGDKLIIKDPERFDLVRKMWDLFLTGTYSVSKIRDIANNEWGLRTYPRRKLGGRPLTMTHMYHMFKQQFYYGYFEWENYDTGEIEMYKGSHPPMITEAEYRRAQVLLGKRGKIKPQNREFAFTGLMHCGECESMITAEEKNQVICSVCKHKFAYENKTACNKCGTDISKMENPKILNYVYYHCTKKRNRNCTQKTVRLEELEAQFNAILGGIKIDEDYLKLALEYLQDKQNRAGNEEQTVRKSLQSVFDSCQTRLANLQREYISPQNSTHGLITPEEFKTQKDQIIMERSEIEKQLGGSKENLDLSYEVTERVFNFCAFAQYHFNNGDLQKKREIFSTIGSNLVLKDKTLFIEKVHPFILIENELKAQRDLQSRVEPKKDGSIKEETVVFATASSNWLRDQGSNLGHPP